jgi:hypothetical protein
MPDMFIASLPEQHVRFLDVSPMISALRFQPTDFEYAHGRLRHVPSRHVFRFDRKGKVTIEAQCGCAGLTVRQEQADDLFATFNAWRENYWRPLETDREFASHFRKPNAWVRLLRDIRMAWRRFRSRAEPVTVAVGPGMTQDQVWRHI